MQAKFSSFIRPKRKAKLANTDVNPFPVPPQPERHSHSSSFLVDEPPHPYAAPDVFDISPGNTGRQSFGHSRNNSADVSETLINPSTPRSPLPKHAASPLHLNLDLEAKSFSDLVPSHLLDRRKSTKLNKALPITPPHQPPVDAVFLDDGDDGSTSTVSSHARSQDKSKSEKQEEASPPKSKKALPTPIHIPAQSPALLGVIQTSKLSRPISGERSPASSIGAASTVSGTTLARALMANSYAFSIDSEASPRTGSALTRADSATLPLDGRYSWHHTPIREALVPPVPSNADAVYVPPQISREQDAADSQREESQSPATPVPRHSLAPEEPSEQVPTQDLPPPSETSIAPSMTSTNDSLTVPSPLPEESNTTSPSSSSFSHATSPGMSEFYAYYEGSSAANRQEIVEASLSRFRPAFSPIKEETSTISSPAPSRKLSTEDITQALTAPKTGNHTMQNWPLRRKKSHSRREASIDGRQAGLPIGPPSATSSPVVPTPTVSLPSASNSERRSPTSPDSSSSSSSPFKFPPQPGPRPVFSRERSGSIPSPIHIIRDPRDARAYYLASDSEDKPSDTSPRSSSDHGRQTFPETPSAFSPTWSSNSHDPVPNVPDLRRNLSRGSDRFRFPHTPQSGGLPMIGSLAQQLLATPATLTPNARPPNGLLKPHDTDPPTGTFPKTPMSAIEQIRSEDKPTPQDSAVPSSSQGQQQTENEPFVSTNLISNHEEVSPNHSDPRPTSPHTSQSPTPPSSISGHSSTRRRPETLYGSPPAYETAFSAPISPPAPLPAGHSYSVNAPGSIPRPQRDASISATGTHRRLSTVGGPRPRPSHPFGPRRPSMIQPLVTGRARQASEPNISIKPPFNHDLPYPTPLFLTPECPWKGHTLDAAMWTFSSETLQQIVAKAIRESAQASRIRLLHPELLEEELPRELAEIESKQASIKRHYQALCQRRADLLRELANSSSSSRRTGASFANELRDICVDLDRLTEDLHSLGEQRSQLLVLQEVHATSSLAMALRKLNSSFQRQTEEHQALQERLEALETEREAAWQEAKEIANELDDLNQKFEVDPSVSIVEQLDVTGSNGAQNPPANTGASHSASGHVRRSSHVLASERALKAGLSIRSNRSSGSVRRRSRSVSGIESGPRTSVDEVPPVPLLRPTSLRSSRSFDGSTPTSDYRAMMQAQEELLELLGLSNSGMFTASHRRSHSAVERP